MLWSTNRAGPRSYILKLRGRLSHSHWAHGSDVMSSLVKLYGEFWNPDIVDWGSQGAGNKGTLPGTLIIDGTKKEVDCWDARGIYILHENFRATYVGKAFSTPIGKRLRDHLTDRLAGRWDMFSWYSTSNYRRTKNDLSVAGQRNLNPETIISTLEALAILIADPPLNRKRESLPNAVEVEQAESPHPQTIRHYLQEIMRKLDAGSNDP